ncbi:MAG: hypothetical protein GDA53_05870 [Rhodobacteraceae bacterium]|nr:hypothetical protein [Paracoccaceae bacterium]
MLTFMQDLIPHLRRRADGQDIAADGEETPAGTHLRRRADGQDIAGLAVYEDGQG